MGVVAGDAGVTISSPAAVLGFVREGRLRAIAIGAPQRSSLLPDVPTLAEAGVENEVLASTYFAFALPGATPRPIVERLQQEMKRAVSAPEVAERLNKAGLEPTGGSGEELLELVKRDVPRFRQLVTQVGIQPE
jgi:tripartite-type tricarboxylate transporter receptor subunit TctC